MVEGIDRLRARDEAGFAAWLLQIARITVAGYYRKREGTPGLVSLDAQNGNGEGGMPVHELTLAGIYLGVDPADLVETRDEWRGVVDAINALTEEQRQVLVGRLILGYDVETVARLIGKKANAVKALQFRALHSLHRLLGRRGYTEQVPSVQTRQRGGQ
jgi:RNA polymerase sigma-70 factor (ECF subfamily)